MLYQEAIHVPLIILSSNPNIKNRREFNVVENFDIFSTILNFQNINYSNSTRSISLWERVKNKQANLEKYYAFSERRHYKPDETLKTKKTNPKKDPEKIGKKYALQDKTFKYIYRTDFEDEFYNLKNDPLELNSLINEKKNETFILAFKKKIHMEIDKIIKDDSGPTGKAKIKEVDSETIKKLESLGYVQ